MDPAHPASTSMVEGEHASTNIHRLIVIDGSSTVISEVRLKVTGDDSIVYDCSTAAYRSCYLSH